MNKLEILCDLYKKVDKNYNSDKNSVLEYDDKDFGEYEIDISLNKQNKEYLIFIFIEKDSNLIFKGLYEKNTEDISNSYFALKQDLYNLNIEDFVEKTYEKLIENLR